MPVDASIYAQTPQPKSSLDFDNEYIANQLRRQGLQQNQLAMLGQKQKLDEYTRGVNEQQTIRNALMQLGPQATDDQRIAALKGTALPGGFAQADALQTSLLSRGKTEAETKAKQAESLGKLLTAQGDLATRVFANPTPEAASSALANMKMLSAQLGIPLDFSADEAALQQFQSPDQIKQWAAGHAMKAQELLPKLQTVNAGNAQIQQAVNPLTGQATETGRTAIAVSPDAQLSANTSRANNAANIAKDYAIAGMSPDGKPGGNVEKMAQAIANGQAAPITGFALAKPQGQTVMRRVFEINPNYDETTYAAKTKAARDFTSGNQGNAMRSFNVAGQHLDQLGTLVDALDNGNLQLVNKVANAYKEQTGSPAPTNFDAAKDVVSKEVVKAIVAGGGGVAERQELADLMSKAKSPAQLKGVIQQYRSLMAAQHDALLQQRRAAGLPDSTLPNYQEPGGAGAVPPDIAALIKKHGGK